MAPTSLLVSQLVYTQKNDVQACIHFFVVLLLPCLRLPATMFRRQPTWRIECVGTCELENSNGHEAERAFHHSKPQSSNSSTWPNLRGIQSKFESVAAVDFPTSYISTPFGDSTKEVGTCWNRNRNHKGNVIGAFGFKERRLGLYSSQRHETILVPGFSANENLARVVESESVFEAWCFGRNCFHSLPQRGPSRRVLLGA